MARKSTKYRISIDLRPGNAATFSEVWPMPNIDAELTDFVRCNCFRTIEFCEAYWRIPFHKPSRDACGIIASPGVSTPTRAFHGLKHAAAHFQSHVPQCIHSIQRLFKSWIIDFIIYTRSTEKLLQRLDDFLAICWKRNIRISAWKCKSYQSKVK